jgi:hypothetical protein
MLTTSENKQDIVETEIILKYRKLRCFETTLTSLNYIQAYKGIKNRLNSDSGCQYSIKNLLFFCHLKT